MHVVDRDAPKCVSTIMHIALWLIALYIPILVLFNHHFIAMYTVSIVSQKNESQKSYLSNSQRDTACTNFLFLLLLIIWY